MFGGNYTFEGGFWSIIAGVPLLRVALTSTNTLLVAWPASSTGFSLEQNSDLSTAGWTAVHEQSVPVANERQLIISTLSGTRFYRLRSP
jgi:hypothetical protein